MESAQRQVTNGEKVFLGQGLEEESRRPASSPKQLSESQVVELGFLRADFGSKYKNSNSVTDVLNAPCAAERRTPNVER